MKTIFKFLFLSISFLSLTSCEKAILGRDEVNDPENNFELFWKDFDAHYGLFTVKKLNWDSLYSIYRPLVNKNTTNDQLFKFLSQLIEPLNDGHTHLLIPVKGGKSKLYTPNDSLNASAVDEFSKNLVMSKYLDSYASINDSIMGYGTIKGKNIGYIYIEGMDGDASKIDVAIENLKNYKAIILDLRANGGGDDNFSARAAGAFADGEHFIYSVQTRNGSKHTDFTEKKLYYTHPAGNQQFLKPVIILTSRYTISAAEIFLLHMKSFNQVTQIGDTTAGDFSDMGRVRFLPNGWVYTYSIQMFLMPDGSNKDGIGHIPDVYIKNTKSDIASAHDIVMEQAIKFLFDTYGIQ